MSLDQCHSTVGETSLPKRRTVSSAQVGVTGQAYWRGLDDVADTPEFRDLLEREFPSGASRLLESSRRTFLKLMGASVALAGAATLPGCRRPDHKIFEFSKDVPEEVVPGRSLYYATSVQLPGGAVEGLIVETHEGRPTKVEGNPLHAANNGKSSARAQAAILSLYDPDRLKDPVFAPEGADKARSWEDVRLWSKDHFGRLASKKGAGLAIVVDKKRSVSRDALKARVMERFPQAAWIAYDPTQSDDAVRGSVIAFGKPMRTVLNLEKADVVVSLDADFLFDDPAVVRNTRGFASRRHVVSTSDTMSRVYIAESTFSVTGAKADHRVKMAPGAIAAFAAALARALCEKPEFKGGAGLKAAAERMAVPTGAGVDQKFVEAAASDLLKDDEGKVRGAGTTLLVAGPTQPAAVHALVHAINAALGNAGTTVTYRPMSEDEASSSTAQIRSLADAMRSGKVETLVCIGVNPVYDAPGDVMLAEAMAKVPMRISADVGDSETVAESHWRLPLAHDLERWGDLESHEGTIAPVQPMIAPLYGAWSELELLALIAGDEKPDGHTLVRAAWQKRAGKGDFEQTWRRGLLNGVLAQAEKGAAPAVSIEKVGAAIAESVITLPTADKLDVVFTIGQVGDGSMTNNGWLQELPDPMTKVVWDNVALVNKATAERYGLRQEAETDKVRHARMVSVIVGGVSVKAAAWEVPGIPDNTVVLMYGYGRRNCGRVGDGTGFNVYPISGLGGTSRRTAHGATLERVSDGERWYPITSTQSHGSMEGRAIVREVDLAAWRAFGDKMLEAKDSYGRARDLNFAERLGELSHTPANYNAYINPQRATTAPPPAIGEWNPALGSAASGVPGTSKTPDFANDRQWGQYGMTIDLTSCTGCGACTVACQAENNIPIVGKIEANKQREMHWIRVDRYYSGTSLDGGITDESVSFQPVACVHCENAPCETVCPVNATVHGPEGINYMVYNRCIGTRYCANNCPYKVRRFNFFDYGVKKFNGDYIGKEALGSVGVDGPKNVNLVPPRLRERLDEITRLGKNPNVTVRSRGVMEKCTYCLQRINEARIEVKLRNLPGIPDGFFQSACQQACPADSIIFGDIHDTGKEPWQQYPEPGGKKRAGSRVANARAGGRSYLLLGYLNTRPRTSHMLEIRNPNLTLVDAARLERMKQPFHHGGGHGEHDGHGGHDDPGGHGSPGEGGQQHGEHKPTAANFYDKAKAGDDRGYRLSLSVIGASA